MKNLLIGLLMLVTTNLMATTPVPAEIPSPPSYKVKVTHICEGGLYYYKETSDIHTLVEKMFTYDTLHKKWVAMTCTGA